MVAVFFALPQESRDFLARLGSRRRVKTPAGPLFFGELGGVEVAVFHVGMGQAAARARLRWLAYAGWGGRFEGVVAAGFAGGLSPSLEAGSLVLAATECRQAARARAILGNRAVFGKIATSTRVLETPEAKARFAAATGALAVEMENAAVAEFAAGHPLVLLRAVTDAANEAMPVPNAVWFDAVTQRPRPLALLAYLAVRPWRWRAFARFVRNVGRARRVLAAGLLRLVPRLFSPVPQAVDSHGGDE